MDIHEVSKEINELIEGYTPQSKVRNMGTVIECGDGVAKISGLESCKSGELIEFDGGAYGIAMRLEQDNVGCVILSGQYDVASGTQAYTTGKVVQVPVGEALLGRVVDPQGRPLDAKGTVHAVKYRPIEMSAPSIIDRAPVSQPLQTGLVVIDAIVPIGKGQRELIIGDRQTGKTAVALDAIINQKDKNVYCIYVAIGQKASTVAQIVRTLEDTGALQYTTVVCSTASDAAPMQYIAPYTGCAMAEEFMYSGKDVLIVYDDLSKHAVAYRSMSLLLGYPPGREAFPGDVFYLHSRLLERAAKLNYVHGGGSMTALPIIETMEGDISAYIPTNVISITDGQIYLESELFFSGVRPAVNVGLSVSRVGGAAQTKAMRKVSGQLRLELAQYRELAVFAQFGSELDKSTRDLLSHGARLTEALKQNQYSPKPMEKQVVLLYTVSRELVEDLSPADVSHFLQGLDDFIVDQRPQIYRQLANESVMTDEIEQAIRTAVEDYRRVFKHADEHK